MDYALLSSDPIWLNHSPYFTGKLWGGILNLSKYSTTLALYFLLGGLPIEGKIRRNIFLLFSSFCKNPESKIFMITKYPLETTQSNSRTWAAHVRHSSKLYNLPDSLECLKTDAPSKAEYKEYIQTKISAYHENHMRVKASDSSSRSEGQKAPWTIRSCNYTWGEEIQNSLENASRGLPDIPNQIKQIGEVGGSPLCWACPENSQKNLNLSHILTECPVYADIRERMFPEFSEVCRTTKSSMSFEDIYLKTKIHFANLFWTQPV